MTKEQLNDPSSVLVVEVWRRRITCDSFLGELIIPLSDIPEGLTTRNILDHTETKMVNFYQPRALRHLLSIMHTRERFSTLVNQFLQWRLFILLRVDLRCVVRANQAKMGQVCPCEQSAQPEKQEENGGGLTNRLQQMIPDAQVVMTSIKAHKALLALNLASHSSDLVPACVVQYMSQHYDKF